MDTLPEEYLLGRKILGDDLILPEDIVQRTVFEYSAEQLKRYLETFPNHETLERLHDSGFVLVAGPGRPMSTGDVLNLSSAEKFAEYDVIDSYWFAFRKESVPNSTRKNWTEQQQLIAEDEYVPNVAELCWGTLIFSIMRGRYLFQDTYVRTNSIIVSVLEGHVLFGRLDGESCPIAGCPDTQRQEGTGISSAMRF